MGTITRNLANNIVTGGKVDGTDGLTGTIPASNVANDTLGNLTAFPATVGDFVEVTASDVAASPSTAGQLFYNSTSNTLKGISLGTAAWASGGALNTGRHNLAGTGTQTAGLAFGGTPPVTGKTEEYNGTAWTESGDLNNIRDSLHGFGTQTAAVGAGGYKSPSPGFKDQVEEYDGSSWTNATVLPATRAQNAAAGTLTAGLVFGGHTGSPYDSVLATTVEYDGTNWTSGGSLNNGTRYISGAGTSQTNAIDVVVKDHQPLLLKNIMELHGQMVVL